MVLYPPVSFFLNPLPPFPEPKVCALVQEVTQQKGYLCKVYSWKKMQKAEGLVWVGGGHVLPFPGQVSALLLSLAHW